MKSMEMEKKIIAHGSIFMWDYCLFGFFLLSYKRLIAYHTSFHNHIITSNLVEQCTFRYNKQVKFKGTNGRREEFTCSNPAPGHFHINLVALDLMHSFIKSINCLRSGLESWKKEECCLRINEGDGYTSRVHIFSRF